jgi:hypothetical protein
MQPRRANPFFSTAGCGTTLLLALVLAAILYFRGGGPFSPGPLTAAQPRSQPLAGFVSHAEFEQECSQCHVPWRGITAERCQNCHEDVGQQRASGTGLHGLLPDNGRCESCHTDHQGREANITALALVGFDHERLTQFSLARHQQDYDGTPLECGDCHVNGFAPEQIDCVGCHRNADAAFMAEHTEQFGSSCLECHDGRDRMANFDHDQVFPLDGAHATVECQGCHVERVFEGTPRECVACHQEPAVHAGLFGLDCVRCHTTTAWTPAQLTQHTFPLDHGGEGQIACESCHQQSYTVYTCDDCHEPAEMREEHADEGIFEIEDCAECHPTGDKDEAEEFDDDDDD